MAGPNLQTITLTVPANGVAPVPIGGTMVKCLDSSGAAGAVKLRFEGGGGANRFDILDKIKTERDQKFEGFTLHNLTGVAIVMELTVGDGDVDTGGDVQISGTVTTEEAQADIVDDVADVTLTNGVATQILPLDLTRTKAVIVSDPANANNIRLGKAGTVGAARGAMLQIGQAYTHNSTAALWGFVAAAGQKVSITVEQKS